MSQEADYEEFLALRRHVRKLQAVVYRIRVLSLSRCFSAGRHPVATPHSGGAGPRSGSSDLLLPNLPGPSSLAGLSRAALVHPCNVCRLCCLFKVFGLVRLFVGLN